MPRWPARSRDSSATAYWRGTLPGRDQLAGELGVSHTTMEAAMRCLAQEGLLVSQGTGKRRRIVLPEGVIRWAKNIARGKNDRRQFSISAEFVEGGTIGPAAKR